MSGARVRDAAAGGLAGQPATGPRSPSSCSVRPGVGLDFVEVYAVFTQVPEVRGFSFAGCCWSSRSPPPRSRSATCSSGRSDRVVEHVRSGTFDVVLLRPLSALGQLAAADLQLRRSAAWSCRWWSSGRCCGGSTWTGRRPGWRCWCCARWPERRSSRAVRLRGGAVVLAGGGHRGRQRADVRLRVPVAVADRGAGTRRRAVLHLRGAGGVHRLPAGAGAARPAGPDRPAVLAGVGVAGGRAGRGGGRGAAAGGPGCGTTSGPADERLAGRAGPAGRWWSCGTCGGTSWCAGGPGGCAGSAGGARRRRDQLHGRGGRVRRLHRRERGRQVDDDQDADRDPGADLRVRPGGRAGAGPPAPRAGPADRRRLRPAQPAVVGPAAGRVVPAARRDPPAGARARPGAAGRCVELLGLASFLDTPVRQLSLGQRMRGELTAALLHSPELLLLDEPTVGLDIVSKEALRDVPGRGAARPRARPCC